MRGILWELWSRDIPRRWNQFGRLSRRRKIAGWGNQGGDCSQRNAEARYRREKADSYCSRTTLQCLASTMNAPAKPSTILPNGVCNAVHNPIHNATLELRAGSAPSVENRAQEKADDKGNDYNDGDLASQRQFLKRCRQHSFLATPLGSLKATCPLPLLLIALESRAKM